MMSISLISGRSLGSHLMTRSHAKKRLDNQDLATCAINSSSKPGNKNIKNRLYRYTYRYTNIFRNDMRRFPFSTLFKSLPGLWRPWHRTIPPGHSSQTSSDKQLQTSSISVKPGKVEPESCRKGLKVVLFVGDLWWIYGRSIYGGCTDNWVLCIGFC